MSELKEKIEKRVFNIPITEFRALEKEGKRYLEGYAAVFNTRSKLILEFGEYFYEEIEPRAFSNILKDPLLDVYLTLNHSRDKVIARTVSGTLKLREDTKGLYFLAEIPNNVSYANDVYELVQRGDLYQNSFAFAVIDEDVRWEQTEEGIPLRIITNFYKIYDVSVVTHPAYDSTSVLARDLAQLREEQQEEEQEEEQEEQVEEQEREEEQVEETQKQEILSELERMKMKLKL